MLGMSSNRNMALDTFRQVAFTIQDNDFLVKQIRQIRLANGQESITLLNGARYEIAAIEASKAEAAAKLKAEEEKAEAKAALLERLGITGEEAALLLS